MGRHLAWQVPHLVQLQLITVDLALPILQSPIFTPPPRSTLYTLQSTLHISHSTLDTPHSRFYTLHSTLYTLHSSHHTLYMSIMFSCCCRVLPCAVFKEESKAKKASCCAELEQCAREHAEMLSDCSHLASSRDASFQA